MDGDPKIFFTSLEDIPYYGKVSFMAAVGLLILLTLIYGS
jgi:hypothetical protein